MEYLFHRKHYLKMLYKSKHFAERYRKKTSLGVFFGTHQ